MSTHESNLASTPQPPPRPSTNDMFSPRSTAAMALSSICQQEAAPIARQSTATPRYENSETTATVSCSKKDDETMAPSSGEIPAIKDSIGSFKPTPVLRYPLSNNSNNSNNNNGTAAKPPAGSNEMLRTHFYPPPSNMRWAPPTTWTPQARPDHVMFQQQQQLRPGMLPPPPPPSHFLAWGDGAPGPQQLQQMPPYRLPTQPPHHAHFMPQVPHHHHHMTNSLVRPPPQTLVTPTPHKKLKTDEDTYSRKTKSLGVLAETFLARFSNEDCGTEIVIDSLASEFAVERRRIYDVVNIFESVHLVVKKAKNTYRWMGINHLQVMFAILQGEAIEDYPHDALKFGLVHTPPPHKAPIDDRNRNKSLCRLSQQFLQVFLVGNVTVSLPEASDKIHGGCTSLEELATMGTPNAENFPHDDPKKFAQAAARGLKTKIRRLYDIANVFWALGLLTKMEDKCSIECKRPVYSWIYPASAMDIRRVYHTQVTATMIALRNPFSALPMHTALPFVTTSMAASASASAHRHAPPPPNVLAAAMPSQQQQQQQQQNQHMPEGDAYLARLHQGAAVWQSAQKPPEPYRRVSLEDQQQQRG